MENNTDLSNRTEIEEYSAIKKKRDQFSLLAMTANDFYGSLLESNLGPFNEKFQHSKVGRNGIGFVLFDENSEVYKVLPSGTKTSELSHNIDLLLKE